MNEKFAIQNIIKGYEKDKARAKNPLVKKFIQEEIDLLKAKIFKEEN
ncbi:MAG: hypothetical protein U9P90_01050 [Patescibacteria group bacterium]|nr:hypothetical protein [Patescibacteria group bacterium]